jgi:RNA polymerase sigma factor (sigma-70 family)
MANQRKNEDKQKYYIPMEVKKDTIITPEYESAPRQWSKIGNRMVRTILIPATKEQYRAYMQPEWKEDKRQQRLAEKRKKREKDQEEHRGDKSVQGWDTPVSYEQLAEMAYGFADEYGEDSPEEIVVKEEFINDLHQALSLLQGVNRQIVDLILDGYSEAAIGKKVGRSQKAVNNRKKKIYEFLRNHLKDYRNY